MLRATWLSTDQLRTAEWIFHRTPEPEEVRRAFDHWDRKRRELDLQHGHAAALTLDEAFAKFGDWLDQSAQRSETVKGLRIRLRMFVTAQGRRKVADVTPEVIEQWLRERQVSAVTRDNDRRALSRFFAWCIERPQRFIATNPAREVRIAQPERGAPEIYTLRQVMRLLIAAKRFQAGRFLPFIVLQLFGGMRPTEALRFGMDQIKAGSFRLEGQQTKTRDSRTCDVDPVLAGWLARCPKGPVSNPHSADKPWAQLKAKARLSRWITDGLRHTAVSHYFRRCGSYGETAEWAGNSEAVIRDRYQARTTAAETSAFLDAVPRPRGTPTGTGGAGRRDRAGEETEAANRMTSRFNTECFTDDFKIKLKLHRGRI